MKTNTIKIFDLSTLVPGPFATYLLSKYIQAEVTKIVTVQNPDLLADLRPTKNGISLSYSAINRNKKTLTVDFRQNGVQKIKDIIKTADIFLHNFKAKKSAKLGLSFADLSEINPKLLYCSISGYSPNTPLSGKSAHDLNILSLSGYLDQQLQLGGNILLPPLLLADMFSGYHIALRLVAELLFPKSKKHIQISMSEAFQEAMIINNYPQDILKKSFSPTDFIFSGKLPCYSLYRSKDGGFVAVAALEKPLWIDFCNHMEHAEWIDSQFDLQLTKQVAQEMTRYDKRHWLDEELDFCVTPVLSYTEAKKARYV